MLQRRLWCLAFVVLFTGCGDVEEPAPPAPPEDLPERLGNSIGTSLADLMTKPRAELAALAEEWTERAQLQERFRRDKASGFGLLPQTRIPLFVPVLRQAAFSSANGFSLPPYVAEGTKDIDLAVHLARYGDDEAARKLVDPNDADAARRIADCRYDKNYPVEWTRLTGLMLHVAQVRLAQGDIDAATELVVLHRQLRDLLDEKAAHGPLGAALLAPGRQVLAEAAAARRGTPHTAQLAEDIDGALAAWGETPIAPPAVSPGASRADVARILRSPGQGRAIAALTPIRGLDLLDLPLPPEGTQAVLALFDGNEHLSAILVTYRPGVAVIYAGPRPLAKYLEERGVTGTDSKGPGSAIRSYPLGDFTCEAVIISRGNPVGAFVRFAGGKSEASNLPRDFGSVNLDRSFEQNRLRLAPEGRGNTVATNRATALAQLKVPLSRVKPISASIERATVLDGTARIRLRCAAETGATLHEMAMRLWADAGPARIEGQEDANGGHLVLTWEDDRTKVIVRWPYATGEAIELEADDEGKGDPSPRATFDLEERKARLAAGKPLTLLPRYLDYEGARLGATRAQVLRALPWGENILRQNFGNATLVTFTGEAPKASTHVARQWLVRCDDDDKVIELRTRYSGGVVNSNWSQALLDGFTRRCGACTETPGNWASIWSDLPARKPAATLYRWQDDLTILTCQRDAGGVEIILRDASGPDPSAASLPATEYLPRGPSSEIALGTARADVLKVAGDKPQMIEGAVVVTPPTETSFDALLVWFEGDRVSRIVARHAQAVPPKATPAQLAKLLSEAWGRDARKFGWPARQDVADGQHLQGLGWHDEHTRVRLFWQESENGPPRLYTEWKAIATK